MATIYRKDLPAGLAEQLPDVFPGDWYENDQDFPNRLRYYPNASGGYEVIRNDSGQKLGTIQTLPQGTSATTEKKQDFSQYVNDPNSEFYFSQGEAYLFNKQTGQAQKMPLYAMEGIPDNRFIITNDNELPFRTAATAQVPDQYMTKFYSPPSTQGMTLAQAQATTAQAAASAPTTISSTPPVAISPAGGVPTAPTQTPPPTTSPTTPSQSAPPSQEVTQAQQLTDQEFEAWLNQQTLSADQKQAVRAIYGALGTNDQATADRVLAAFTAAREFSDPYFAAQISLATDALQRGLASNEGNLSYQLTVQEDTLADLKKTIERAQGYLTFQQQQELENLTRNKGIELDTLQQDMAARGFTSSSIRTKKEGILEDVYEGLVESSNRSFLNQQEGLAQNLSSGQRDYQLQVARLQQFASEGKLDLLRQGEQQLGSGTIANLGYQPLGGVEGSIEEARARDEIAFAQGLIF